MSGEEEWDRMVRHVRESLVPRLEASDVFVSLVPREGGEDVKIALELGLAVLLDKPILAVVRPGEKVSARLRRVADRVIEVDLEAGGGVAGATGLIRRAVDEMMGRKGGSDDARPEP